VINDERFIVAYFEGAFHNRLQLDDMDADHILDIANRHRALDVVLVAQLQVAIKGLAWREGDRQPNQSYQNTGSDHIFQSP
jgi:hypothetical protein